MLDSAMTVDGAASAAAIARASTAIHTLFMLRVFIFRNALLISLPPFLPLSPIFYRFADSLNGHDIRRVNALFQYAFIFYIPILKQFKLAQTIFG
jgi:hypothetical protein